MIVKYAGDILADVNKVYVIIITDQGVQSLTFPALCDTSGFFYHFHKPTPGHIMQTLFLGRLSYYLPHKC